MDFAELQGHVFRLMRDPNATKYSLDYVKKWLNEGERQYCNATDYSVKKNTTITTTSGTQEYTLPTDFISEIDVYYDGQRLGAIEMTKTIHQGGAKSGTPHAYYIENKKLGLEYVPTAAKTVTLIYFSRGGAMSAAIDTPIIPDEHHMLLVVHACIWASIEGDDTRLNTFMQLWMKGLRDAGADVINLSPWPELQQYSRPNASRINHDLWGA